MHTTRRTSAHFTIGLGEYDSLMVWLARLPLCLHLASIYHLRTLLLHDLLLMLRDPHLLLLLLLLVIVGRVRRWVRHDRSWWRRSSRRRPQSLSRISLWVLSVNHAHMLFTMNDLLCHHSRPVHGMCVGSWDTAIYLLFHDEVLLLLLGSGRSCSLLLSQFGLFLLFLRQTLSLLRRWSRLRRYRIRWNTNDTLFDLSWLVVLHLHRMTW